MLRGSHCQYIVAPTSGESAALRGFAQISGRDAGLQHTITVADSQFTAMQAIREFYMQWRHFDATHMSDRHLSERLSADVQEPFLTVFYLPDEQHASVLVSNMRAGQPMPPLSGPVVNWSITQKIVAMFQAVPNYLLGAAKAEFLAMMTPQNIAIMAAFMAAVAGAQAIPGADVIVDGIIAAVAWVSLGWSGLIAGAQFGQAVISAGQAQSESDIQNAAKQAAAALVTLGVVAFLGRLLKRVKETKAAGDTPSAEEQPPDRKPSPKPKPKVRTIANPDAYVKARVNQLQQQIPAGSRGRITMAVGVVQDQEGAQSVLVGTSEPRGYLRPGVTLEPGETVVPGTGHAEADIVNYAQQNNLNLLSVGATRPVCPGCQSVIPPSTTIVTPLK
jgi:hypothetical protein